jgi:hypothetical protein
LNDSTTYGPVPNAFRLNGASFAFGPTYSASACFGSTMPVWPTNGTYQPGVASLKVSLTVVGSSASAFSIGP